MELRAIQLIQAERQRQKKGLGYTRKQDDNYASWELVAAGYSYLIGEVGYWPWDPSSFKLGNRFENLVKSGALYQAAIDQHKARKEDYTMLVAMRDAICAQLDSLLEWAWDAFVYSGDVEFCDHGWDDDYHFENPGSGY